MDKSKLLRLYEALRIMEELTLDEITYIAPTNTDGEKYKISYPDEYGNQIETIIESEDIH